MQPCLSNKESLVALPLEDPSLKQEKWWYKPQMLCSYYHSEFSLSQFWMDLTFPWFTEDIKINKENKRIKRNEDAHTLEPEIQNLSKNENPRERGMSEKERSNTWNEGIRTMEFVRLQHRRGSLVSRWLTAVKIDHRCAAAMGDESRS